jgi:hypothetical protein
MTTVMASVSTLTSAAVGTVTATGLTRFVDTCFVVVFVCV